MANDLNGNPFAIDTPGVADLINGKPIYIKTVTWTSPAAVAGHRVIITTAKDRLIWESVAAGANHKETDHLDPREDFYGLKVLTLDSGRLLIYIL